MTDDQQRPPDEVVLKWNEEIIANFRANGGHVVGREGFEGGDRILLLTTTGARTGKKRISPMSYVEFGGLLHIVGSNAGIGRDPNWVSNLRAHPEAFIEIKTDAYAVYARELRNEQRNALWEWLTQGEPRWAQYQSNTEHLLPVFELTRL